MLLEVSKIRLKDGHLELLLNSNNTEIKYNTWIQPRLHPNLCSVVSEYLENNPKLRISGSRTKLVQKLFN